MTFHYRKYLPAPSFITSLSLIFFLLFSGIIAAEEILKSPADTRDYAAITLDNGLRVILVSDPDTDKAAASLDVNVGYFQDPKERPGLAHFLEHMLFLGTEKYPDANSYKEFISNHGGMDNAYTASEHTNYFFDIDKDFLDETLDRFSQFFIAPLFDEDFVQREMNAVNSEYRLKIKDDNRRNFQALKATINADHPLSKFSVGNLESLSNRPGNTTRNELIDFHKKYYSANLMTLSIIGKEPINELKKMAQRFSSIKNNHIEIAPITTPLLTKQQQSARIHIIPLQETRSLTLSFTSPWHNRYYEEKPFQIISHLLGYEGKDSLHSLLKKKGWINSLSAGSGLFARNYITFDIDIDLTREGLEHVDEITTLVFQAIALIKQSGIKNWIHDEIQQISELNFRFREKSRPSSEVLSLARNLHDYPASLAIKGPYISKPFSFERVMTVLNNINSSNLRQIIIAPGLTTDKTEPYYDTAYSMKPLPSRSIKQWQQAGLNKQLAIPSANPFIPERTDVLSTSSGRDKPVLIIEKDDHKVWHKQDDEFKTPKADIRLGLASTSASETIEQSLKTSLYLALLNDNLNEFAYPAALAGLHYSAGKGNRGIGFSVSGYDDKQQELLTRIIDTLVSLKIDAQRFAVIKQRMQKNWKNSHLDRPYQQLNRTLGILLQPRSWTPDAYLDAIKNISIGDIEKHRNRLLKQAHIGILIHGNINEEKSRQLANDIIKQLRKHIKPSTKLLRHSVKLRPQKNSHNFSMDIDHNDSAIISFHQAADDSTSTQAQNLLLLQVLETPFFNQLRTAEQLGYVVYTGSSQSLRLPAIKFVIQSPVKGPQALLVHINNFIQQQFDALKDMDAETFAKHQQAILTSLLEKDKRLSERTRRYQNSLALKYLDFNHREELATAIRNTTIEELSDYYQALLLSKQQRRIVIESTGYKHRNDDTVTTAKTYSDKALNMDMIDEFRKSQDDNSL